MPVRPAESVTKAVAEIILGKAANAGGPVWIPLAEFAEPLKDFPTARHKNIIRMQLAGALRASHNIEIIDGDESKGIQVSIIGGTAAPPVVVKNTSDSGTDVGHPIIQRPIGIALRAVLEDRDSRGHIQWKPYLVGPTGSGKSVALEWLALHMKRKNGELIWGPGRFIRQSLAVVRNAEDLIGGFGVRVNNGVPETVFVPGVLAEAAKSGKFVIFDELDQMSPEVNQCLQTITESNGRLYVVTQDGPTRIDMHPDFVMAFTGNTEGYGDQSTGGFYSGCQRQNYSFLNRIGPKFTVDYDMPFERRVLSHLLPPAALKVFYGIPRQPGSDPTGMGVGAKDQGIVYQIRNAIKNGVIVDVLSLRTIVRTAKMLPVLGWHVAMKTCFINDFDPNFRGKIEEMIVSNTCRELCPTEDPYYLVKEPRAKDKLKEFKLPMPAMTGEGCNSYYGSPVPEN